MCSLLPRACTANDFCKLVGFEYCAAVVYAGKRAPAVVMSTSPKGALLEHLNDPAKPWTKATGNKAFGEAVGKLYIETLPSLSSTFPKPSPPWVGSNVSHLAIVEYFCSEFGLELGGSLFDGLFKQVKKRTGICCPLYVLPVLRACLYGACAC